MADQTVPEEFELAHRFYTSLKAAEQISPERLIDHQREVATTLLQHVEATLPFYRERLAPIRRGDGTYDFARWGEVPMLTKADVVANGRALRAPSVPDNHGKILYAQSSASTGVSLRIPRTQLAEMAVACASYRHMENHKIDWSHNLAMIRALAPQPPRYGEDKDKVERWGPDWLPAKERGRRHRLSVLHNPKFQLDWLARLAQVYVNTLPSNIMRLARTVAEGHETRPQIKAFLSVGERVDEDLRDQARTYLNAEIIDVLATSECGTLAVQCPVSKGYHVQSELGIVEIITDDGAPAGPGERGRVVATPLFNLAMPLIRYRFDDYVRLGPAPCPCGRPAPLIDTIYGRTGDLFSFPDGSFGPLEVSTEEMARHLGPCRWQIVQTSAGAAELLYMPPPISQTVDAQGAADYISSLVGDGVRVSARAVPALGPGSGGKYRPVRNETDV